MAVDPIQVPAEFKPVRGNYPVAFERLMGYGGPARFVGFYWDSKEDALACDDGTGQTQWGNWEAFIAYLAPAARSLGANFGASDDPATHLFIFDRLQKVGYVGEREPVETFLKQQHAGRAG